MKPTILAVLLLATAAAILVSCESPIPEPSTVAQPAFSVPGGTYTSAQAVSLSCPTPEATIRYTTDGTDPTSTTGTVYAGAIAVGSSMTIKAIAYKAEWLDSSVASATYTINITGTVAAPTFSPPAGTYTSPREVTISCATPGAAIRYTTDGTEPSMMSRAIYEGSITLSSVTTVKAVAYKAGWTDSEVATAAYVMKVATPTFSPVPGTYTEKLEGDDAVAISCTTPSVFIRYTIDGTEPTKTTGTLYSDPIPIDETTTLKAIAYKNVWAASDVASGKYTITGTVKPPDFSPGEGTYTSEASVEITSATDGASIRYTTDGTDPSNSKGTLYTGAIPVSITTSFKAVAYKDGWIQSGISSSAYTIKVATPTFYPNPGTSDFAHDVTLSCATDGATIRYTTNGADPTSTSSEYTGAITVSSTLTMKAKAFKAGCTDSDIASGTYTINDD